METTNKETRAKMEKALSALKQELSVIRTGVASLAILDGIKVDYYGTLMPLNQVASLNIPDPRMISIQPWEAKIIPEIEKAILRAGIGLTPSNDGKVVRLPIPTPNEERRKELVKLIKKYAEEGKVALRMLRRDANEHLKKLQDVKTISEDDFKKGQNQIQKLTDEYSGKVDELVAQKEKSVLSV